MQAWSRRQFTGLGAALSCGAASMFQIQQANAAAPRKIPQPLESTPKSLIDRAFKMRDLALANGDQGYGAVIVNSSSREIVGQSPSRVVQNGDPTAHAEMEAIRDATHRLGTRDLSGHEMYSSSRPCPMCEAAAFWANIGGMHYGRGVLNAGRPALCHSR